MEYKPEEGKLNWRKEALIALTIFILALPIYCTACLAIPNQVSGDEDAHVGAVRYALENHDGLFATSGYFNHPNFEMYLYGVIAKTLFAHITVETFRNVSALIACLEISGCYLLFRSFPSSRALSVCAILILATNHSYFALQRMALVNNSALIFEIPAYLILLLGLNRRSKLISFCGGAVSGLSFYTFFPSRLVFPIWLLTTAIALGLHKDFRKGSLTPITFSIIGFAIVVAPMLHHLVVHPDVARTTKAYFRECSILTPEGQEKEKAWEHVPDRLTAVMVNIRQGLTVFNNNICDRGWLYTNARHGFVDPLSGALVWLGLLICLANRKKNIAGYLTLTAFGVFLLVNAFGANKAPNYTRLMCIWPFAAYFIATALIVSAKLIGDISFNLIHRQKNFAANAGKTSKLVTIVCGAAMIFTIFALNYSFLNDFQIDGQNDPFGVTARFIVAHPETKRFVVCYNPESPYFYYGDRNSYYDSITAYALETQESSVIKPNEIEALPGDSGFTLLITSQDWDQVKEAFKARYKTFFVRPLCPDCHLLAITPY